MRLSGRKVEVPGGIGLGSDEQVWQANSDWRLIAEGLEGKLGKEAYKPRKARLAKIWFGFEDLGGKWLYFTDAYRFTLIIRYIPKLLVNRRRLSLGCAEGNFDSNVCGQEQSVCCSEDPMITVSERAKAKAEVRGQKALENHFDDQKLAGCVPPISSGTAQVRSSGDWRLEFGARCDSRVQKSEKGTARCGRGQLYRQKFGGAESRDNCGER
ncbi:hypothetical protein C8R47DRAFT_1080307 [Mycena vitilis]|nr:hypothetical protein C8R47DRAFT_1080307 [Mycena vitilis]